jgi:hypothetical protein
MHPLGFGAQRLRPVDLLIGAPNEPETPLPESVSLSLSAFRAVRTQVSKCLFTAARSPFVDEVGVTLSGQFLATLRPHCAHLGGWTAGHSGLGFCNMKTVLGNGAIHGMRL